MAANGRHLLILGLLRRGDLSAYDVAQAIKGHSHLYRELRGGNVYEMLDRLHSLGLVTVGTGRAKRGPRVEKTVYSISLEGAQKFLALLREIVCDVQTPDWLLEVSYVLLGQLSRAEALDLLRARLEAVSEQERRMTRLRGDVEKRTGGAYMSAVHATLRLSAEAQFLRDMIKLLRTKTWSASWDDEAVI